MHALLHQILNNFSLFGLQLLVMSWTICAWVSCSKFWVFLVFLWVYFIIFAVLVSIICLSDKYGSLPLKFLCQPHVLLFSSERLLQIRIQTLNVFVQLVLVNSALLFGNQISKWLLELNYLFVQILKTLHDLRFALIEFWQRPSEDHWNRWFWHAVRSLVLRVLRLVWEVPVRCWHHRNTWRIMLQNRLQLR